MMARSLGRSGLHASEISFGAWPIGGNAHGNSYGPTDDTESQLALALAVELGCTLVDTADVYGHGHSEALIGQTLREQPDVLIATKVGGDFTSRPGSVSLNFAPTYIRRACEESLRRLRRECLDIYLLHNPPPQVVGDARLYETMEDLRQEGKIRAIGVSIHGSDEGLRALGTGRVDLIQVAVNWLHREAATELLDAAERSGVGIMAREPLANGFLTGKYDGGFRWEHGDIRHTWPAEFVARRAAIARRFAPLANSQRTLAQAALQYPLSLGGVSTVVVGCKTRGQVRENLSAGEVTRLGRADFEPYFQ